MALNAESAQHLVDASTRSSHGIFDREGDVQEAAFSKALTEIITASIHEMVQWQTEWSGDPDGVSGISEASGKNIAEAQLQSSHLIREDLRSFALPVVSLGAALAKEIAALRDTWNGSDFAHHPDVNLSVPLGDEAILSYDTGTSIWTDVLVGSLGLADIGTPTFRTIQQMQDVFHSSGWLAGGGLTDNLDETVDIAAGSGLIRATDSRTAQLLFFDWSASAGISIPTDTTRYIGVEYNAGSPQVVTKTTDTWDYNTDFPLHVVVNEGGTLHVTEHQHAVGDHANFMIQRLEEVSHVQRASGLILGETGTRNITTTAGVIWDKLNRFAISALDTSVSDTFDRYYRDGGGGFTKEASQTQWNNTQYDDGSGTLASLTTNWYTARYFYMEQDGNLAAQYGRAQYATLATAVDDPVPNTAPDRIAEHALLIGRMIIREGGATAEFIESAFETTFGVTGVSNHDDLAGITSDNHHAQIHKDSHDPQTGGDPLNCAAAAEIASVQAAGEGTADTLARSDHAHAINHSIADNHLVTIDGVAVLDDYAKFTAGGLLGRTYAEVASDIQASIDHGSLSGLGDSADHTWALLLDGTRALTADWDAGAFGITANQLLVGDADDIVTPSEYIGVGASQDGKFYSLAAGTVYLDAITSDADFYLRANDGGTMKDFLVIDSSAALLTLGQTGDIIVGANGTVIDIYPETTLEANLGTASKLFNEVRCDRLFAASGITDVLDTTSIAGAAPTEAELDAIFGQPETVGAGFIGLLDDNGNETDVFLCVASATQWHYVALTVL
jgi:hypothetical protein